MQIKMNQAESRLRADLKREEHAALRNQSNYTTWDWIADQKEKDGNCKEKERGVHLHSCHAGSCMRVRKKEEESCPKHVLLFDYFNTIMLLILGKPAEISKPHRVNIYQDSSVSVCLKWHCRCFVQNSLSSAGSCIPPEQKVLLRQIILHCYLWSLQLEFTFQMSQRNFRRVQISASGLFLLFQPLAWVCTNSHTVEVVTQKLGNKLNDPEGCCVYFIHYY